MGNNANPAIIGGMFGLQATPDPNASFPPFLRDRSIYLVNARSGIGLVAHRLAPRQVWCPSYLCHVILDAVKGTAANVRFYPVNYDLAIASLEWIDQVQQGDLVILIDYFGFACDLVCATRVKEQGAWVLEDASQALLSREVGRFSDFVVFSPRKFLGIPDGSILTINRDINLGELDLKSPSAEWWLRTFAASVLRREFDIHGGTRQWFEIFQKTESESPIGSYAMSDLSRTLLLNSFDYSTIARRRVENYQFLASVLSGRALFPHLAPHVVPLGFPIRVKNRDQVRRELFEHQIYPPVHWQIQDVVPENFTDSHRLAADIMTLPCDQRYTQSDMKRIAQLVSEGLR